MLYDEKCKGAQVRSRAKWIKEGEKSTKYFFSLEKKHQSQNIINELCTDQNDIVHSNNDILGEMCTFYENLYSSKQVNDGDIDNYLSTLNVRNVLSEKDQELCDKFPSLEECEEAVKNMKSNKSPGLDGLTSEFYKCFWNDVKYLFYNSLKNVYDNKEMSFSQRLAVMTLIHKKGDKKLLKNYRPLSLTNTDYKIIAFVFARRLQKIIDNLINKNQSAYIKGRFIGENARLILDIFDYCEENNYDGILLFLDFEKAFDSVEWNFLIKSLEKFNFGREFITWIKILYCNPVFRVKNNGWLSKTSKMSRGIRQGCPISALLYIFVAEILALKIHENVNIQGFELENTHKEIKTVQHADDLTVLLKNAQSLQYTLSTIREFCSHAGSKVNIEKTECVLLGSLKNTFQNVYNIKVNTTCIKCLGIYLGQR